MRRIAVVWWSFRTALWSGGNIGAAQSHGDGSGLAVSLLSMCTSDLTFLPDQLPGLDAQDLPFRGRLDLARPRGLRALLRKARPPCRAGIDIDGLALGCVIREGAPQSCLFQMSGRSKRCPFIQQGLC
jgi:hypothetical protein